MPDIVITPNRGTSNNPKIDFTGTSAGTIKLEVLADGSIAWNGANGSLFSISDSLSGSLMSVNDISGLPAFEVFSDNRVIVGQFGAKLGIGITNPSYKLDVSGTARISGATIFSSATTFNGGNGSQVNGNGSTLSLTVNGNWNSGVGSLIQLTTSDLNFWSNGGIYYFKNSAGGNIATINSTNGNIETTGGFAANKDGDFSNLVNGISLWGSSNVTTSISYFKRWSNIFGRTNTLLTENPGYATYHLMDTAGRGWVWRYISSNNTSTGTNVASLRNDTGQMSLGTSYDWSNGYHAQLNIAAGQGSATTYRDIDMHGSWSAGEGHAITATHGGGSSNIVGQIVFQHDSPGSRIKFGKLYHSGDTTSYPLELISTSATAANLILNNGNVGLGVTGPSHKLHFGAGSFIGLPPGFSFVPSSWTRGSSGIIMAGSQNADGSGWSYGGRIVEVDEGDGLNIAFDVNYTNSWTNNAMVISGRAGKLGNVGIGTTSPGYKLHVEGDSYSSTGFYVRNSAATFIGSLNNTSGISVNGTSSDTFIVSGGNQTITVKSGGNVGIGTTSPAEKLHVNGGNLYLSNNPTTNDWGAVLENTNTGGWGVSQFFKLYGYGSSPAGAFAPLQIRASYPGFGQVDFLVKNQAQSTAIAALTILGTGNVGIGTSSPSTGGWLRKLSIAGTDASAVDMKIYNSDSAGQAAITLGVGSSGTGANNSTNFIMCGSTYPAYGALGPGMLGIYHYNNGLVLMADGGSGYIDFATGGSASKMRLTSGGNVGIGTTSPAAKLEINGTSGDGSPTFRVTSTAAGSTFNWAGSLMNSSLGSSRNYILLIGQAESTKNSGYIGFNHSGTGGSNNNFLTFGLYGNDNILNVTGAGNVGIGTTSPGYKLEVIGDAKFGSGVCNLYMVGAQTWRWIAGTTGYGVGNGFGLYHDTGGAYRLAVDTNGNVGIGTTSPNGRLDVVGDIIGDNEYSFRSDQYATNDWDNSGLVVVPTSNNQSDGSWFIASDTSNSWARGLLSKRRFRRVENLTIEYEAFISNSHAAGSGGAAGDGGAVHCMIGFVGGSSTTYDYYQTPANLIYHDNSSLSVYDNGIGQGSDYSIDTRNAWYRFKIVMKAAGARYYVYASGKWNLIKDTANNNSSSEYVRLHITLYRQRIYIRDMKIYVSKNHYRGNDYLNDVTGGSAAFLGNVGVGTTSPGYKLEVNGTFKTNNLTLLGGEIYVSANNTNTLNSGYTANTTADIWINYRGYNDGHTQFRNFNVGDGKGANIAWFDGTNKRMSINNGQSASYTLHVVGDIYSSTTVRDQYGDLRTLPENAKTGAYTLATTDTGRLITITTGGITVPANATAAITAGMAFTIYNNSGSNQTITQAANVTMYLAGTATTGNRTLAQRGIATVVCVASSTFVISGSGLT